MDQRLLKKLVCHSAGMQAMCQELAPCVKTGSPLLFWGKPGSGMGFSVGAIHAVSRQGKLLRKPCFELDDAAFSEQLFGNAEHGGWLEEYHQGTIFFKHITETSLAVQQILGKIIGNQSVDGRIEFSRKGATEVKIVNVRFIFSMVKAYDRAMQEGSLLRELAEVIRRRGKILHLPPLRERKEDILKIAHNLIEEMNAKYAQRVTAIDQQAQNVLIHYDWPENVDEMKRLFEGIFSRYPGIRNIASEHLPKNILDVHEIVIAYSFTLKNKEHFSGTLLADTLAVQSTAKDRSVFQIKTTDLFEIHRVDDPEFVTPKLRHFVFTLKNGDQLMGNFAEKIITVKTAYASSRQINVLDLYEIKPL
ncbi:MAG: sigma 54-interacting transcriptional regulator [Candidatus Vecturithrix sp.]|jgi:DNA-binding NtrC family response regulator|nr:sigma 54-interacting transcriptional regulator [Candidatus Vecturithrix sp.]